MTNQDIARALGETADLIELTGGNPYRANAFNRAARALRSLDRPAADLLDDGSLTDVGGVGDAMAEHIEDLIQTGSFEQHDELQSAVPPGLLDMLRVKGLGTSRVRTIWKDLDVTSLDELEQAAMADRITTLDGFGAKTQENVLENVRLLRRYDARRRYADAVSDVRPLLDALQAHPDVSRVELTGPMRRRLETVEQADLIVVAPASTLPSLLEDHLDELVEADDSETPAEEWTGRLPSGLPVAVTRTDADGFGSAWWRTTGSEDHVAAVEAHGGTVEATRDEADLYAAAGLSFVPPELREGRGEIDAAAQDALPPLLTQDDLQGSLHNHSTYSDGAHSLRQMAEAARNLGLSYFGISDHSQSLRVADGLTPEEVQKQQREIQTLNEEYAADGTDFRIFSGIESDILKDGSLDYDDEILASFDFIVASIHTGFSMTEDEATERIARAVANPHTRILGHPTGRLLLVREGYSIDHGRVIEACAEHDVAIELNANPYRLDIDWRWVHDAVDAGVLISINPDAHATGELENVRWGVEVARKGWLTPDLCLNAKSLDDFAAWIDRR